MRKFFPLLLTLLFFILPLKAYGETNNNIDLTVFAKKVSFDFVNIKPGDSLTEKFTISNNGGADFNYLVISKSNNLLNEDKLFQQLDVDIKDSNGRNLYKGKLHKIKDEFGSNLLKSKESEELTFCFIVPYELGNEFQGQETHFYIQFYAEGTIGGILPVTGQSRGIIRLLAAIIGITAGSILLMTYIRRKKEDKNKT